MAGVLIIIRLRIETTGLFYAKGVGECRIKERIDMVRDIPENGYLTLIFKPTYACNLACPYCYGERWRDSADDLVSVESAKRAFAWVCDFCRMRGTEGVKIIWHGGEPLLAGPSFLREVIEFYQNFFARYGIEVKNVIQTNATLLNEEYINIFHDYFNSRIGFSFDYQSGCRRFPDGSDAAGMILEKAMWARSRGIDVGAIMVCNRQNVGKMDELFSFMAGKDIPFKFSRPFLPYKPSGQATAYVQAVTDEEYVDCVCQLIDIALRQNTPRLAKLCTTVQDYISAFLLDRISACAQMGTCSMSHLCVGPNGDIYPCSRFTDKAFRVGDYLTDSCEKVMENLVDLSRKYEGNDPCCQECKFIRLCKGGCTLQRITGCHEAECWVNRSIWEYISSKMSKLGLSRGALAGCVKEDISEMVHTAIAR